MLGISPKALAALSRSGRQQFVDIANTGKRLSMLGPVPLPMEIAGQRRSGAWHVVATDDPKEPHFQASAIAFGDLQTPLPQPPLVRIHSTCFTGDVLGSKRCDCGPQLEAAVHRMHEHEAGGLLVYLATHEGRGIGLWAKAAAYLLQDQGADTYQANRELGFEDDLRTYDEAAALIRHFLGERPFHLLTNNPKKVGALHKAGLRGCQAAPLLAGSCERNHRYLEAKRRHGHFIPNGALAGDRQSDASSSA